MKDNMKPDYGNWVSTKFFGVALCNGIGCSMMMIKRNHFLCTFAYYY